MSSENPEPISPWKRVYDLETRLNKARRAFLDKNNEALFKRTEVERLKREIEAAEVEARVLEDVMRALEEEYSGALYAATYNTSC